MSINIKNPSTIDARSGKVRLFVSESFNAGKQIKIIGNQLHYLRNVMRMARYDTILVFNGIEGEWIAEISNINRQKGIIILKECTRIQSEKSNSWLLFAPLKSSRTDFLIEKSTEIGVGNLVPLITDYTQTKRFNVEKHYKNAVEAAEQCGRLDVPIISSLSTLDSILKSWPSDRLLFFCDEQNGRALSRSLTQEGNLSEGLAFIVGPEGGFSVSERETLLARHFIRQVSLGPFTLRSETAALVALGMGLRSEVFTKS
tara:strand:- start:10687 stop:11460 length:774 start_codon:yes stop_codon:yes gene_type:complete